MRRAGLCVVRRKLPDEDPTELRTGADRLTYLDESRFFIEAYTEHSKGRSVIHPAADGSPVKPCFATDEGTNSMPI
jgi:hypothetical protein